MTAPVDISIELPDAVLTLERRRDVEAAASTCVHGLLRDLGLPASPRVTVLAAAASSDPSGLHIRIDDVPCRMRARADARDPIESHIATALFENRQLLATPAVLQAMRDARDAEGTAFAGLSPAGQDRVFRLLIERLFGIARCRQGQAQTPVEMAEPLRVFEHLIADVRTPRVAIAYNARYARQVDTDATTRSGLQEKSVMLQDGLFYELGIIFPTVQWESQPGLPDPEFVIRLNDVALPALRGLALDTCLVNDTPDRLHLLNVTALPAINPANGSECAIIAADYAAVCEQAGLTTWDAFGYMVLALSAQLRRHAGSFVTLGTVQHMLERLRLHQPALVDAVVAHYDLHQLTWILRALVDEELSLRHLPAILEQLLLLNGRIEADLAEYIVLPAEGSHVMFAASEPGHTDEFAADDHAEYVRGTALRRAITHKYARGGSTLVVYLLDPDIENALRGAGSQPLGDADRAAILHAVHDELGSLPATSQTPAILTTADVRRRLQRLLRTEFPHVVVLSYTELSPEVNIQPIARITLDEAGRVPAGD